jgi:protein subunit release factor A
MSKLVRELLVRVTAKDCRWDYFRGSGKGGQKKNKKDNAVRCTHQASGAVGKSEEGRSQLQNKKKAFVRMAKTKEFNNWVRVEAARASGVLRDIEENVEKAMRPNNIKIEVKKEGRWVENDIL